MASVDLPGFDKIVIGASIRFIMLLPHGPTDPATVVELTDWQRVEVVGRTLGEM